jgi:uncharacterized protein
MRWTPGGKSRNIEDRRGQSSGAMKIGGGAGGIVLLVLALIFGGDVLNPGGGGAGTAVQPGGGSGEIQETPAERELVEFVSFVLDDAQEVWTRILPQSSNNEYRDATLVLFRGSTRSGCGVGQAAMGPFYCPLDEKVYIDLSFFEDLRRRFGAPGDFAQAYVIAHEIGHHVQHVLGINQRVRAAQSQNPQAANDLSVRTELQADCFAGVWGHSTNQRRLLDASDIEEGLNAAAAIGDDRIAEKSGRVGDPESFTHGTAAQRVAWFRRGLTEGDPRACDTFAAERL